MVRVDTDSLPSGSRKVDWCIVGPCSHTHVGSDSPCIGMTILSSFGDKGQPLIDHRRDYPCAEVERFLSTEQAAKENLERIRAAL